MKFLRDYKEIWFGLGLGILAWLVDALMHVQLGADVHAGSLWGEIFAPNPTALIFRGFYMVVALSFGVFLWRTNWRERQLHALEVAVIAFQRRLDAVALRISSATRGLQSRNSIRLDEAAMRFAAQIDAEATLIDDLAKKYFEFSQLVQEGETSLAIEALDSIESWLAERQAVAK